MKIKQLFQLILKYIKTQIKTILLAGLFIMLSLIIFSLYRIDLEPVLYAAFLSVLIALPALSLGFLRFYKTHSALLKKQSSITIDLMDLPKSQGLIEDDYQKLIEALYQDKNRLVSSNDKQIMDMVDYYTLWVHQIKTPIAAMSLLLQIEDHPRRRELERELFKIEQYVEMVMAYLRLSSDSTDYVIKNCDLDSIIKQIIRKFTPLFIKGNISLNYAPLHQTVITDEKWFLYSIEQLISNALKYTPEGEISIYTQDNKLVIEDNGIGIASPDLPRIFERGFTGYNGRIDKKASGLGLYLCKSILTRLSHSLEIKSSIKKGTKAFVGLERMDIQIE